MTHPRPAGPAVPSLSEASVVWPPSFLLCLSAPRWLGNAHNPLAGSPAIPRGIHVSLHQNQLWGCPSLLWNSPSSLEVGTLARAVSSGLAPVSVSSRTPGGGLASSLSSVLQTWSQHQLVRAVEGSLSVWPSSPPRVRWPTPLPVSTFRHGCPAA